MEISALPMFSSCFFSSFLLLCSVLESLIVLISALRSFSFICDAAFFVNVTAKISLTSLPDSIKRMIFSIMTVVFPLPAEADTIVFPLASIAARCSSVNVAMLNPPFRPASLLRFPQWRTDQSSALRAFHARHVEIRTCRRICNSRNRRHKARAQRNPL